MAKTDAFRPGEVTAAPGGQLAHPQHIAHSQRLQEKFYAVGPNAWCYVGNGLSNQTFIRGPGGIIAIDTGECVEEMQQAIKQLRTQTDLPITACIYTHFHYVAGTTAICDDRGDANFPIYGHSGIEDNLQRFGGEVGPRGSRGMVHQFAMMLPESGPDGLVNIGLGRFYRNPGHAPYTPGHLPATETFDEPFETTIAGLRTVFYPAPSDATDSVNIHFPDLDLAVNNIFWPTLFNIFAIRGEEYRDPRILLVGLDELAELNVEHQICAHGPPMSGRSDIRQSIERYRDSIQLIWDQTVRFANRGFTLDEMIHEIKLPDDYEADFHTQQLYGVVEHHVRQVYTGLFGWFDEDASRLFPLPPRARAEKMIAGFGGRAMMRTRFDEALADQDYRWALELGHYLTVAEDPDAPDEDRLRLASALRAVGQSSPGANIRNWCLTRALEVDGTIDLKRFRIHRIREAEVLAGEAARWVAILRVFLDAEQATGFSDRIGFSFDDGSRGGLMVRHSVAVPVEFDTCALQWSLPAASWAKLLSGKRSLSAVLEETCLLEPSEQDRIRMFLGLFDPASLKQ